MSLTQKFECFLFGVGPVAMECRLLSCCFVSGQAFEQLAWSEGPFAVCATASSSSSITSSSSSSRSAASSESLAASSEQQQSHASKTDYKQTTAPLQESCLCGLQSFNEAREPDPGL